MPTNYPGSLDSYQRPSASDTMDTAGVQGDVVVDNLYDAVEAIETELGAAPSAAFSTVKARLDASDTTLAGKIGASIVDAKGDLLVGTAADTVGRLPVGTNYGHLKADSAQASGVKWLSSAEYDVRDYGAVLDNVADDTAAIQAAINACSAAGGGVVYIPGHGNTTKVKVTQLGMRAGVTLRGTGLGGTTIRGSNAALDVIVIDETAGSVDRFVIEELTVEGGKIGLLFVHTNNANQLSFARGVIRNVLAVGAAAEGFYISNGALEYRLENCHAKSNGADGFRVQSTDHFLFHCTSQANAGYGFRINGANNHLIGCKAFGNARGFDVSSRHVIAGCDAQENNGDGFRINGADTTLSGCLADCNAGIGFNIIDSDHHTLTGCHSTSASGLAYTHTAGFKVASGSNREVTIVGCSARETVALDAASVISGCTVDINGSLFESGVARANHTGTQSADTITDGATNKAFLATERTKLAGVATGATANDTDANLKARANHTGTQLASTISDFAEVARDTLAAALVAGSNITITPNDGADTITIDATGGSSVGSTLFLAANYV